MKPVSSGPLEGLRVLDLARGTAGSIAGHLLADYGAEVLRIEPPGGDPLWEEVRAYPVWHRGKSVVEIDLAAPRAREALLRRLSRADVLLESFAPGTMARFGLDPASVAAIAPRLVYVSISAYGADGPDRDRPGFDALVQARAGLHAFQGAALGRPVYCVHRWPSLGAGLLAVIGCLAALRERARSGRGLRVETSLYDGVLAQSTMFALQTERTAPELEVATPRGWTAPTMAIYACGDGRSLHIHTGARGALDRLLAAVGLARDAFVAPGSGRHLAGDPSGAERLRAALAEAFGSRPRDAWVAALMAADVPVAPCLAPGEALRHPQAHAAELAAAIDDPLLGRTIQPGIAVRFARSGGVLRGAALRLGVTPNPEAALRHAGWPADDDAPGEQAGSGAAGEHVRGHGAPAGAGARLPGDASSVAPVDRGASAAAPAGRPLDGVRVLDFGMFAAGPYAAMVLADLGAEVVKVEPLEGDTMRPATRRFLGLHRGKRGLALDLKSPLARAVVDRLVARADVLIHNLRPGVADRLGIGAERLCALNPRLVYCHGTAYGTTGPLSHLGGFDQMLQAMCGLEEAQAGAGNPPAQVAGGPLDYASALLSAAAIAMALVERERSGIGQALECPQLGAALFATADMFLTPVESAPPLALDAERNGYGPAYRLYRAGDGVWLFVCCPDEAARERLAALVGGGDARAIEAAIGGASAADWLERLSAAGVPAEVVEPALGDALLSRPELVASGRVAVVHHARYGEMRQPGGFIRFSGAAWAHPRATPLVGEHTREILAECGFDREEVDALREARVVDWPDGGG